MAGRVAHASLVLVLVLLAAASARCSRDTATSPRVPARPASTAPDDEKGAPPSPAPGGPKGPAAGAAQGPPPALVTVAEVREGQVAPEAEYVGTLFYPEVSDVSAEVPGGVREVRIDDGRRVRKGEVLVRLDDEVLEKSLAATKASREQVLAELEKAERDLARTEKLFKEQVIAEQAYDENRFRAKALEKRAESLRADVERLEAELRKKAIAAPFDGVIVKRLVDRGEWVAAGDKVATLARDDHMDAVVELPAEVIPFARAGATVRVKAGGKEIAGRVIAVVPRGDVATRTIPVKVRVPNTGRFIEGMEAVLTVPVGERRKAILVPRDAVVTAAGTTAVYAVGDGKAKMVPVRVLQYVGITAGVEAEGLRAGMVVAVKGNERLRDGQPVVTRPPAGGGKPASATGGAPR